MEEKILKFKEKLEEDAEFRQLFVNAFNLDEIVDIARENDIELDLEEIMNDPELSDQFLEAVAGGRDDTYTHTVIGKKNFFFEAETPEEAGEYAVLIVNKLHENDIYGPQGS